MKNILKVAIGALALTAATSSFAGQYPFPQNMKHPHGTTIEYADTDMIKAHYQKWKKAWYNSNNGWIYAPEGTGSTVSEAIAYGMLIAVYMDDQSMFDKVYGVWTSNGGNGGGMNWRIGEGGGTGSATDADVDAALALVMASKQWSKDSYLTDAKKIISWIGTNDINGGHVKPGNQWNDAFNPSYGTLANFELFKSVDASGPWSNVLSTTASDLKACQNSSTGLVPDWCDWNSHKPTKTSASVAQTENAGFFDDAARTPWRMAWAYYWYGNSDAKAFNKKVSDWLIPTTHTASGVNSGYYVDGQPELSTKRRFVSSTFSGGLGLATSSVDGDDAKAYLGTTYKALSSLTSCETAQGCGEGVAGEKYYPATLNLLYLLLMTGNMPNLYDISKFTKFTPDPSKAPSVSEIGGTQMQPKDTTVGLSGFWNWGAYHDKLNIGTKMVPDSGSSPLFLKEDGQIYAEASMEIGPEPEWTKEKAEAGLLKYPSAGIAMSFLANDKKGVNFNTLGIKAVRVTMKSSGPIRMAILNEFTAEAGAEPGIFVPTSSDYKATTYDMTPYDQGVKGFDNDNFGGLLDWVDKNEAPEGTQIVTAVTGFKWEVKDAKGGIGEFSIKSIEFLDASGNVIDPATITGIKIQSGPITGIKTAAAPAAAKISVSGMTISAGAAQDIAVFSLQGKKIASGKASVTVPSKGIYLVRVNGKLSKVNVK